MSIRTRFNPLGTIGRKSLLPVGYIELEYLESTGTQYIDTGIVPDTSTRWEVRLVCTGKGTSGDFDTYGTRCNVPIYQRFNIQITGRLDLYRSAYGYGENSYWDVQTDAVHTYCIDAENLRYRTDEGQWNPISGNISGIVVPIMLFAMGNTNTGGNTVVNYTVSRCYYSKIWKNSKLVRNFIPTLDPTGRPCMFDTVTQQPYYNQGTGEFKFGYKLPEGYTVVEYLEGTGTQYIDTGVDCTSNTGVEFKAQMLSKVNAANAGGIYFADGQQSGTAIRHHCTIGQTVFYWYGTNDTISKLQVPVSTDDLLPHEITINPVTRVATFDSYSVAIPQFDPFRTETNYYLFSRLSGATGALQSRPSRIYYFKLFNNGRLVRSFIPTLDASNRPCMYDLVKRKTYYNQGTGEFLYG